MKKPISNDHTLNPDLVTNQFKDARNKGISDEVPGISQHSTETKMPVIVQTQEQSRNSLEAVLAQYRGAADANEFVPEDAIGEGDFDLK